MLATACACKTRVTIGRAPMHEDPCACVHETVSRSMSNYIPKTGWGGDIGVPVAQWLEHCVSSAKVVGSIPREHILTIQMYSLNAL